MTSPNPFYDNPLYVNQGPVYNVENVSVIRESLNPVTPVNFSESSVSVVQPSRLDSILGEINSNYKYSLNLSQAVLAGIEAKILDNSFNRSFLIGLLVLLSSAVPPTGVLQIWGYNEKLWETLIATFIGGGILNMVYGGSYLRKAGLMLLIDTSSMILTDEIYTLFILGGYNSTYADYRSLYPQANFVNRVMLG